MFFSFSNGKSQVYKELCETQDKELEAGLLTDLKVLQLKEGHILYGLAPHFQCKS